MIKRLKDITVFVIALVLLPGISRNSFAVTYYTQASGSASNTSSWWTLTSGGGTHPANFTTAADIFTVQNGHTMTTSGNGTWTVAGTVVINSGGILTVRATNLGALTINGGGTMTTNRTLTVNGATNITGTINFSATSTTSRLITLTGDITLNSGAVWNVPATGNGANNTFTIGGNFTNNATSFNDLGTGVHTFSGTAKTFGGATTTSIGSVTITGTRTNSGTLTVRTTLAGTGGLTNGNGTAGTLNLGGSISVTTLTATAANNLVNYTGVAQTARVTTYVNLTYRVQGQRHSPLLPPLTGYFRWKGLLLS